MLVVVAAAVFPGSGRVSSLEHPFGPKDALFFTDPSLSLAGNVLINRIIIITKLEHIEQSGVCACVTFGGEKNTNRPHPK